MSYRQPNPPGTFALIAATVFPTVVIVIEWITGLCAGAFFDPLPTPGHVAMVATVPIVNVLLWRAMRSDAPAPSWLIVAGTAASVIAASYALIFLPLLPFALVGIVFMGVGLLPFAPVVALIHAARWTLWLAGGRRAWRPMTGGALLGLAALVLADLPATMTQVALDRYERGGAERADAIALMRRMGDSDLLLRQAYGDSTRPASIVGGLIFRSRTGLFGNAFTSTGDARELYYRVTGQAFNAVPRPARRDNRFAWDEDRGGEDVGGRVPGLSLGQSRIDGSVNERDSLAYLEWTIDLVNKGARQQEARFTLALPEGAVVSRATLWVNGEPREASIAGRGAVKAAYQRVVSVSRDPLLVTTDGAQRLLVQAFPVPPNATMKLRIGVTAPFAIAADGARTLALPRIVERNFDTDAALVHALWVEGGRPVRANLGDGALTGGHHRLTLPQIAAPRRTTATVAAVGKAGPIAVEQRIERGAMGQGPLMLVVDGSADMAATLPVLGKALDAITPGRIVGMVTAADTPATVAPAPWSPAQAARVRDALAAIRPVGGQDDRAALAQALRAMPRGDATILWLHGAQPVRFTATEPALEQALDRLPALPRLVRYQAVAGRALVVPGERWFDSARLPTPGGDPVADLRALLASGPGWQVERAATSPGAATGSAHLVRLWAADQLAGEGEAPAKSRETAIRLAHRLNIVTPVSGAVVLETDKEYKDGDLPVPDSDAVPTVPEPETWALLILTALAALWLWRRQRRAVAA
ncbi:hypothetical protein ASG37_07840 [Sphingomonas sp. Leaf407]|uniref:VIT domain-containing protein n=1 Tax=unclassified Sphingomonas TaxID=196159 RepID=UPI0006FD1F01|nr:MULTISPECIES: VIT domain-containing protein [unclassified Sphingomonas]KQN39465.1 hypothetical protein ASE97_05130 [Sphingomonas sp. Leaf42]KQT28741.1 hypothetical protein ASG37_07840 [Sphingomonas sp. Leaf407]